MTTMMQRRRYLKARVALALYGEYHRVPQEDEIERAYRLARVVYTAVLGTQFPREQRGKGDQPGPEASGEGYAC